MATGISPESREFSAKNVDTAIEIGLAAMGLTADQVDIEIVRRGSRGILGIGSEDAIVRVTPLSTPSRVEPAVTPSAAPPQEAPQTEELQPDPQDDETVKPAQATAGAWADEQAVEAEAEPSGPEELGPATVEEIAREILDDLLSHMGISARIESSWAREEEGDLYLNLDIRGQDLGVLIGRHGKTLSSLQFLLRLMINQRLQEWPNVVVDVEQYKVRHRNGIATMAQRMAEQVVESGSSLFLEPMPAADRRLVHIALRDHPRVETHSVGEGERRKVQISLKEPQA